MNNNSSAHSSTPDMAPGPAVTPVDRLLLRGVSERRYAVLELSGFAKPGPAPRGTTPAESLNGRARPDKPATFALRVPRSCDRA